LRLRASCVPELDETIPKESFAAANVRSVREGLRTMHRHRKAKAAVLRADHDSIYRPSVTLVLLALALAMLLAWHGMARAEDFAANPSQAAQLPDAVRGPGADRIPPGLACSDAMDYAPEDNMPSPFDADRVAFHVMRAGGLTPISQNDGCPALREKLDKV
jgi:hypothetical protein